MPKIVEPVVFKLAETRIDDTGLKALTDHYEASSWLAETLKYQRSDASLLIETAGRACYRSFGVGLNPNITKIREDPKAYLRNILSTKHGSILEHASVTFGFLDVSRVFTHERPTPPFLGERNRTQRTQRHGGPQRQSGFSAVLCVLRELRVALLNPGNGASHKRSSRLAIVGIGGLGHSCPITLSLPWSGSTRTT